MATRFFLATKNGVFMARRAGRGWSVTAEALSGKAITSTSACEGLALAGTRDGIWRSADGGKNWAEAGTHPAVRHVRWLTCSSGGLPFVLAGTEPAAIFVSQDGAETWTGCPEVEKLRDQSGWFLPYSPESGCVRGFAVFSFGAELARVFAAAEVGGVLISNNSGNNWQLVEGSDGNPEMDRDLGTLIHPDVHSIEVHPSSPDLVTAATGGGLYRSSDCGATWKVLYSCYCRAVWVDSHDPQHIIFGPADGVSRYGRIEESRDGGETWQLAANGLEVPWSQHMVERFCQADGQLLAVLSNGELWATGLDEIIWHRILPEIKGVTSVAAAIIS
jgi:photosystem II stability/assembly factor-like uncharacterized protein